jgi:hypothetical protein
LRQQLKEVILWSKVIIGSAFPEEVRKDKISYSLSGYLNSQQYPSYLENISGGMIISLPLENIEDTVAEIFDAENLLSDEEYVKLLQSELDKMRERKFHDATAMSFPALVDQVPLLQGMDSQQLGRIYSKLSTKMKNNDALTTASLHQNS